MIVREFGIGTSKNQSKGSGTELQHIDTALNSDERMDMYYVDTDLMPIMVQERF